KLHCLSDIALLVMKRLTPNFKPPSHAPRLASLHTESSIDEGFVERILLVAQSLFALPPIIDDKRVGKSHDHTVQLDVKKSNEKKLLQVEQAATLESKKRGEKPGAIGNRKKTEEVPLQKSDSDSTVKEITLSVTSESVEIIHGCSQVFRNKDRVPQENSLEKTDLPSSCGSVITKPSSDSQVFIIEEKDFRNCKPPVANDKKITDSMILRDFIESPSNDSEICKKTKDRGKSGKNEVLVGRRISLWSRANKCFYAGTINEYDSKNRTHKVIYDNGNMEILHLQNEKWEITNNTPPLRKDTRKLWNKDR
ncbi:hypothetical protein Taro_007906, partial [Colocasia esculenta]|nr:hypothetical protein [Colocasia esculenta]